MFIPLRLHSVYSRGKGSATLEEASAWVSRKGIGAAALTDIQNLYGWAKWKRAAEARGFRPLFGCELEVGGRQFVFLVKSREGGARAYNLPVVWANPLKFIRTPERLILLHAITQKVPYPPEKDKLAEKTALFGPDQETLALKKFGPAAREAFGRTSEVAEKCRFTFEDIVPPLPPDLSPTPHRA